LFWSRRYRTCPAVLPLSAGRRVAPFWDALGCGSSCLSAAAQDLVVSPAALSNCRNHRPQSTTIFCLNANFRLDGRPDLSRGFHRLRAEVVDRSGDRLRAICEEWRICQQCSRVGSGSAQSLESPGGTDERDNRFPARKDDQAAVLAGRLIKTIPAATKPAAPRIDQVRDSPKISAPSPKARIGVRKENEATVDDG